MAAQTQARWLLIGNTRWHWAANGEQGLACWHSQPPAQGWTAGDSLAAWAAVGVVPDQAGLDPARRIDLGQVPLQALPSWLGIDRALVGWRAWQIAQAPVVVADAGTALSLTRVDGQGHFVGGRLLAGAGLQLQALGQGTAQLPALPSLQAGLGDSAGPDPVEAWPLATEAALRSGVGWGLAAAIATAAQQVWQEEPACQLFLTGGDGALLDPLVRALLGAQGSGQFTWAPDLAMEALAFLVP